MDIIIQNANILLAGVGALFALIIGVRLAGSILLLIVRNIWVKDL
jgi:hypothetical protein